MLPHRAEALSYPFTVSSDTERQFATRNSFTVYLAGTFLKLPNMWRKPHTVNFRVVPNEA